MMMFSAKNWKHQKSNFQTSLRLALLLIGSLGLLNLSPAAYAQQLQHVAPKPLPAIDWPAFDGGGSRSGINTHETLIKTNTLANLTRWWQVTIDATDSSPILLPSTQTNTGTKSIIFVTTKAGSLLALNASDGTELWKKTTSGPRYTTSSPALDPSHSYVYSYGLDGKVHKYATYDGSEVQDQHWPETVTLMPDVEKGSASLNIGNGYLYATLGGYPGDAGHYEGHAVAIRLSDGKKTIFNADCATIHQLLSDDPSKANYCSHVQSAIWARAGAVIDPLTHDVFVATGNGDFDANQGGHDYGDSVLKLTPDLSKLLDSYTPSNYVSLQTHDRDLGSSAPVMLPEQSGSKSPFMLVQASKDSRVRLINRNNLSNQDGPNHVGGAIDTINLPQTCDVDSQPVAWNDTNNVTWVFLTDMCHGLVAYKIITDQNGHSHFQQAYFNANNGGSSPFIANNILYVQGSGNLRAMDPKTGTILWQSTQGSAGGSIGSLHWQSPIIVDGLILLPDNSQQFTEYKILPCGTHRRNFSPSSKAC
ncbi:MAG TPA: PQQ-binding-like beta-propeller repeat protein [Ktedonobacteraceae bacterium]|nr:PQQ-binding-like beta-propeller repeat protein [Ktedonobacteraceae bacterium]